MLITDQTELELAVCRRMLLNLDVDDTQVVIIGIMLNLIEKLFKEKDV